MTRQRRLRLTALAGGVGLLVVLGSLNSLADPGSEPPKARTAVAISYGSGGCGRLEGGVKLPCEGTNYEAFSALACRLGRTWLHPLVAATVIDAYATLEQGAPGRRWQYGDLGLKEGGRLRPHRTHQSGIAADFFVPVVDAEKRPTKVLIRAHQKFGYALEFDAAGKLPDADLEIDFGAIAAHLLALEEAGRVHGVEVERVIITPDFHRALLAAEPKLEAMRGRFMKKEAWVRHDEHYHVDFALPAHLRRPLRCDG
ncbi:MAG TPA: penicillin-insensitive murein endopeptidase [Myxococcaceae bacterium]|nr:penicillin-insensitive murein endopeptidase [Myxococcaceae bacterium]